MMRVLLILLMLSSPAFAGDIWSAPPAAWPTPKQTVSPTLRQRLREQALSDAPPGKLRVYVTPHPIFEKPIPLTEDPRTFVPLKAVPITPWPPGEPKWHQPFDHPFGYPPGFDFDRLWRIV